MTTTKNTFQIETFAAGCKAAMASAPHRRKAARDYLEATIRELGADEIIRALEASIPPGADVGEMIVHASPELTMLYARVPPRFQTGIHNHTVCACIGQLRGREVNTAFERTEDGRLRESQRTTLSAGQVMELDHDVIHCIENPDDAPAHALHLYKGDFGALADKRSLWDWNDHGEKGFSFPELLKESAKAMHHSGNRAGLDALETAIPKAKPMIAALRGDSGRSA